MKSQSAQHVEERESTMEERILLSDDSEESKEAEKVLNNNKITYILIPSSGEGTLPSLLVSKGIYNGLEGIQTYASSLQR